MSQTRPRRSTPPASWATIPLTVLSYVEANPGLSENQYRVVLSKDLTCSSATIRNKLQEAVEKRWLYVSKSETGNAYSVTDAGKAVLRDVQF